MKTEIMFGVASLMLVSAVVVFALPTPVQATQGPHCYDLGPGDTHCFISKKVCMDELKAAQNGITKCYPQP